MIEPQIKPANLTDASDEALMEAITYGRQSALAELYGRHAKTVKTVVTHVVHEEAEAEDVLQEIFFQIWQEAPRYSSHAGRPLGWMVTIARRRAIDRLRRRQAYSRAKDRFEVEQCPDAWVHNGIGSDLVRSDLRHFLERHMDSLPAYQREAIKLAYFEGLSQHQIAVRTGTPLGTVKTRLELGLRKLAIALRPLRCKI